MCTRSAMGGTAKTCLCSHMTTLRATKTCSLLHHRISRRLQPSVRGLSRAVQAISHRPLLGSSRGLSSTTRPASSSWFIDVPALQADPTVETHAGDGSVEVFTEIHLPFVHYVRQRAGRGFSDGERPPSGRAGQPVRPGLGYRDEIRSWTSRSQGRSAKRRQARGGRTGGEVVLPDSCLARQGDPARRSAWKGAGWRERA